jgi:hypothetical protein
MRLVQYFSLLALPAMAQQAISDSLSKFSLQLEMGWFGDFYYTGISAPQMQALTGYMQPEAAPAAEPRLSDGYYGSINLPYLTLMVQGLLTTKRRTSWAAGISYYERTLTASNYYSQTVTVSPPIVAPNGNELSIHTRYSENHHSVIVGKQLNMPFGLRISTDQAKKPRFQAGLNLAPGLTFAHRFHYTATVATATAQAPRGADPQYRNVGENISPIYEKQESPTGMYFTAYAGIPLNAYFNLTRHLQFTIGFEPGYTFIVLDKVAVKSNLMSRLGFGLQYCP